VLSAPDKQRAFAVHYQTDNLPYFSQWKNTVGARDGYVTGLEPGTGFPNPRSFEKDNGRVLELKPGAALEFNVKLEGISTKERLSQLASKLQAQAGGRVELAAFDPDWCIPRNG
jgi:hypothetical protein